MFALIKQALLRDTEEDMSMRRSEVKLISVDIGKSLRKKESRRQEVTREGRKDGQFLGAPPTFAARQEGCRLLLILVTPQVIAHQRQVSSPPTEGVFQSGVFCPFDGRWMERPVTRTCVFMTDPEFSFRCVT